jgi:hypothetical protein
LTYILLNIQIREDFQAGGAGEFYVNPCPPARNPVAKLEVGETYSGAIVKKVHETGHTVWGVALQFVPGRLPADFIPTRRKRSEADRTALKEATARWQQILDSEGISEEEAVADFKRWRAKPKR